MKTLTAGLPTGEITTESAGAWLSLVAQMTGYGVTLNDAQRRIVWANEAFSKLTGYGPEEYVGRLPSELLHFESADPETRQRIREGIVRVIERLAGSHQQRDTDTNGSARRPRRLLVQRVRELGTDTANEAFAFTARVLTGNLVLLGGMVAANQPWRLSLRLSRALTGAVAVGVFGLVYSDVWRLSDGFGWVRLVGTGLLSVGATAATLIIGAELWERTLAPGVRKQVLLFNIATVVTVVIGVTVLYAALYLLALVAAFWFVVPQVFTTAVGHPASIRDYFELAWLTCSLAMIGGALGAALETEDAVREAAYIQRSDAQTERENAMIRPR